MPYRTGGAFDIYTRTLTTPLGPGHGTINRRRRPKACPSAPKATPAEPSAPHGHASSRCRRRLGAEALGSGCRSTRGACRKARTVLRFARSSARSCTSTGGTTRRRTRATSVGCARGACPPARVAGRCEATGPRRSPPCRVREVRARRRPCPSGSTRAP